MKMTEQSSPYRHLEKMETGEILNHINTEDQKVPGIVKRVIPVLAPFVGEITMKIKAGGRLFYIGSGTSGRLGIVDASECPPTFGVNPEKVVGLIAGGDRAIRKAKEFAEDDTKQAWKDLKQYNAGPQDVVIGLTASGTTPYVVGGLKSCREKGILTGCITCNPDSPVAAVAQYPVEVIVGPEFVTGSTRMKAGTAQKLVLNMISTAVMIKTGRIRDNKMVDMQLSNKKLIERGTQMLMELFDLSYPVAKEKLLHFGSVRKAIDHYDFKNKKFKN